MPQMSPMMWELLYLTTFIFMLISVSKTYFLFNKSTNNEISQKSNYSNQKSWKW